MGKEIERKFLVKNYEYRKLAKGVFIRQGFISSAKERVVRIRITGNRAFLTIKGISEGITRTEFEYEIPTADADTMLSEICEKPIINKYRFSIQIDDIIWEVDEFKDLNEGLVIAEVELKDENQIIELPEWIGMEVTDDPKYYNSNLIKFPYTQW